MPSSPVAFRWQQRLPTLTTPTVTVRRLRLIDAESLCTLLGSESVKRFILSPPETVEQFQRFIQWTHAQQNAGRILSFAVVPAGEETAVGLIQVRKDFDCSMAEWGFVISERFWGTGLFVAAATSVLTFLFERVGIQRLEARTIVENGRGNGVLEKLGATREGVLREGLRKDGAPFDQVMWAILASEWAERLAPASRAYPR